MADAKKTEAAKPAASKTKDETPRQKFEKVAGTRFANAGDKIDLLGNVSDARRYEYTPADVSQGFAFLREKLEKAERRMLDGLAKKEKSAKEKSAFKFGGTE